MDNSQHTANWWGHHVTRSGVVYSPRGHRLKVFQNDDGYACVSMTVNGKRVRKCVHTLVAWVHIGPRPSPTHEVRHLDGDRMNPHADNLSWGTRKENAADRELHGRTSRGARHSARISQALSGRHPGESLGEWEIRRYARTKDELYTVSKPGYSKQRDHLERSSDGRPMLYSLEAARIALAATGSTHE